MLNKQSAYKYETPYNGLFVITHCWTNGTVTLQFGAIKNWYIIRHIKPHTFDTNFDTSQRTKQLNKKYGKLPAKEAE